MPVTALDNFFLKRLFSSSEMESVFEDKALLSRYLEVERALATVQAELGIIPQEAAEAIQQHAKLEYLDLALFAQNVTRVGFPIAPLVEELFNILPDDTGRYLHWGATTQDIMDTAVVLQVMDAFKLIQTDLKCLDQTLTNLARKHKSTAMAGRSQLQQALPITFGYKVAVWLSMIQRHQVRLQELKARVLVVQFSGAVGTLASLGDKGLEVQAALCEALGLIQPDISWHSARDGLTEAVSFLALLTASIGKIATDIMLLTQTEIAELKEPYIKGRGSSSTMPQKRNPVSSELVVAAAKQVKQDASSMLEAMIQEHERSNNWILEWLTIPNAFVLTSGALMHMKQLLEGLEVNEAKMAENLELTQGLIVSEAVMMALAPFLGRQIAHDVMVQAAQEASQRDKALIDVLKANPKVKKHLSEEELKHLTNAKNYTGLAEQMVERVLQSV